MEKIKPGICSICDATVIWEKVNGRMVQTPQYAEFSFFLSDGLVYRHAVCANCINNLDTEKVTIAIERIKLTWEDEMVGWANKEQFENMRKLKLEVFDTDENMVKIKHKELKEKERKEKLEKEKI